MRFTADALSQIIGANDICTAYLLNPLTSILLPSQHAGHFIELPHSVAISDSVHIAYLPIVIG